MRGTIPKTNRNKRLRLLREQGRTYGQLAKTFRISRARAKQLYDKEIKNKTKRV